MIFVTAGDGDFYQKHRQTSVAGHFSVSLSWGFCRAPDVLIVLLIFNGC